MRAPPIQDLPDIEPALHAVTEAMTGGEISGADADDATEVLWLTRAVLKRRKLKARIAELDKQSPRVGLPNS
jgi:hypothetical protein